MTERQSRILKELLRIFIRNGKPVSSAMLASVLPFPFSAPSARLELALLEKEGFVERPHASSGSIPTAQGFREIFKEAPEENAAQSRQMFPTAEQAVPYVAQHARLVAFGGNITRDRFAVAGFQYLPSLPEFHEPDIASAFLAALDHLSELCAALSDYLPSSGRPEYFIGEQAPLFSGDVFGMVARKTRTKDEILAVFGPLRMDYRRIALLLHQIV